MSHRLTIAALFLAASAIAAADPQNELERVAQRAIAARERLMQQDATAENVDAFLAFASDELVYEDPIARVKIRGKEEVRKGLIGFLGETRQAHIVVTKRIAVANLVVFEQKVSFEQRPEDDGPSSRWKPQSRDQVTIFEFDGFQIARIADYWSRPAPLAARAGRENIPGN